MFRFDEQEFTLAEMLATNAHDEEVCEWLLQAQVGDSFLLCERIA